MELPLRTSRLELRPFTDADFAAAHHIYSDPEVMRFVGNGPVRGKSETRGMLSLVYPQGKHPRKLEVFRDFLAAWVAANPLL